MAPSDVVALDEVRALLRLAELPVVEEDLPDLALWLAEHRAALRLLEAAVQVDELPPAFDPAWD
jgi:hypothetical protein